MTIRPLEAGDIPAWHRLREALWPGVQEHEAGELAALVAREDSTWAVFVCEADDTLLGFVEAHLREYADGCDSSPVGYVEGWYVVETHRGEGIGRRLIHAAEAWARSRGCTEMASDALIDNVASRRAHRALGYEEMEELVVFRKPLE